MIENEASNTEDGKKIDQAMPTSELTIDTATTSEATLDFIPSRQNVDIEETKSKITADEDTILSITLSSIPSIGNEKSSNNMLPIESSTTNDHTSSIKTT